MSDPSPPTSIARDAHASRCARMLIRAYGADAPFHAALRHDELLEEGAVDQLSFWRQVIAAIEGECCDDRDQLGSTPKPLARHPTEDVSRSRWSDRGVRPAKVGA